MPESLSLISYRTDMDPTHMSPRHGAKSYIHVNNDHPGILGSRAACLSVTKEEGETHRGLTLC